MSETQARITHDHLEARKTHDRHRATLLGTILGAISNKEKTFNPARSVTEAEVVAEVKKMLDGVIETGRLIAVSDRHEQIAQNNAERLILEAYMPQQMGEAEIETFIVAKKAEGLNMGGIMGALKAEFPGRYDGKLASGIAKRVLA